MEIVGFRSQTSLPLRHGFTIGIRLQSVMVIINYGLKDGIIVHPLGLQMEQISPLTTLILAILPLS
jgi:hypothetical protein